jgi:hypothetical protein
MRSAFSKVLVILLVATSFGCSNQTPKVEGTIGFVKLSGSAVDLYNEDGSEWYEFKLVHDPAINADRVELPNPEFVPYAFRPDYTPLHLRVVSKSALSYEVIANEKTGLRKFVKMWSSVQFQSWEQHILQTFSVVSLDSGNMLRESPAESAQVAVMPNDTLLHPVEISGEWLKVNWETRNANSTERGEGWIKWKEGNRLLIEWFYFA